MSCKEKKNSGVKENESSTMQANRKYEQLRCIYLFVVDAHGANLVFVVLGAVVESHFRVFLRLQLRQLLLTVFFLFANRE